MGRIVLQGKYTFKQCHMLSLNKKVMTLLKPFSILMLTNCCKSDQCLHGKRNKSQSMSSSSHHKRMGGEPWWRDWIEPLFIPVSPQPQASQGPPGMLQACLAARKREEVFWRAGGCGQCVKSPLQCRWKFISLPIITSVFLPSDMRSSRREMKGEMKVILMLEHHYLWEPSGLVL